MKKVIICILLTAFLFGTMEVALKIGGTSFAPLQMNFLRFLIGGLILFPLALKDLAVSGKDLILAGIKPGVAMGKLLDTMLDDVLDHPEHNTREYLLDTYVTGRSS